MRKTDTHLLTVGQFYKNLFLVISTFKYEQLDLLQPQSTPGALEISSLAAMKQV